MNFALYILCIIFFYAPVFNCKSEDFYDVIKEFDSKIWHQPNGSFHCTRHRMVACAIASPQNLQYMDNRHPIFNFQPRLLRMWLKNDCDFPSNCCHDKLHRCTHFTTGMLKSNRAYSNGIYLFQATACPEAGEANIPLQACFTLRTGPHVPEESTMGISMCFLSHEPYEMKIMWYFGNHKMSESVHLDYDASLTPEAYGIDFSEPDKVSWIVNGEVVARLAAYQKMPPPKLYITISLLPLPLDMGYPTNSVHSNIDIYRVGFRKASSEAIDHSELFVLDSENGNHKLLIGLILIGIVVTILMCKKRNDPPDGYHALQNSTRMTKTVDFLDPVKSAKMLSPKHSV